MTEEATQFEVLNNQDHADLKVITDYRASFGDAQMQVMVFPFEFRNIQAHYPIFFQVDANGQFYPIALLGFEEGENLFLDEPNWRAPYIPAMLRRQPFLVGVKDASKSDGSTEQARVLSIDLKHPRVSHVEGEALFKPLGGRSEFLEEQAGLLETLHDGLGHCQAFTNALAEHGLIESVTLDISLNDGSRNQLIGLSAINEERVQELTGDVLEAFSKEGYLLPLFMVLASSTNMRTLIDLKNQREGL